MPSRLHSRSKFDSRDRLITSVGGLNQYLYDVIARSNRCQAVLAGQRQFVSNGLTEQSEFCEDPGIQCSGLNHPPNGQVDMAFGAIAFT
ncbi:hypothetical protein D3C87_1828210 [compost metagenome]